MIDIVATAKEMGIYVIVADKDHHSPSKRFADLALDISTSDIDALERLCIEERIDGIFTGFEDFNIHVACTLCERVGLPFYATREQLSVITNKLLFKDKCRECGVPVIEQYDFSNAISKAEYPYIVKPSDSYGSRGIRVCRNADELREGYKIAIATSTCGKAIIERFVDNDHGVELFYTVVNESIHLTATADRYTVRNGETAVPLPVAEVFPSLHRDEMVEKLDDKMRRMISSLHIRDGLVLIQALYDGKGDYFVYEMAYRFTGEQHYRLVERQRGVKLVRMMLSAALGEDISAYDNELLDDVCFDKPSINLALILNPGEVKSITGLERVYLIDEVISYNLTHAEGDVVAASGDYSHMLIRVNMVAENYEKLCHAVDLVDEYVTVVSTKNENMLAAHFHLLEHLGDV